LNYLFRFKRQWWINFELKDSYLETDSQESKDKCIATAYSPNRLR